MARRAASLSVHMLGEKPVSSLRHTFWGGLRIQSRQIHAELDESPCDNVYISNTVMLGTEFVGVLLVTLFLLGRWHLNVSLVLPPIQRCLFSACWVQRRHCLFIHGCHPS